MIKLFGKKNNQSLPEKNLFVENTSKKGFKESAVEILTYYQKCFIERLGRKVEETEFATENLITITDDISKQVEVQMTSIKKVVAEVSNYSALAQEVMASTENSIEIANNTLDIANTGTEAVNSSINAMQEIEAAVLSARAVVNDLIKKSEQINEMLRMIKEISGHTNLLALNASIEAARVGEAGKGFAVVAEEVKNLARRSADSASQISNTVVEINNSIAETINVIDQSVQKVQEGTGIANNTKQVFSTIIKAVSETADVASEISEAVSRQVTTLENVMFSTDEMSRSSEKVLSLVEIASLNTLYTKNSLDSLDAVSKDLAALSDKLYSDISAKKSEGIVLNTALNMPPINYDPHFSYDQESGQIMINVHGRLLNIDALGQLYQGVAKKWYVDEDGLTWIFDLRRGAKFHNGREITAEDVKFSLERMADPRTKSENAWFLDSIVGATEYSKGLKKEIDGLKVLDRYRVSVKLTSPYSGFLLNLGHYCTAILAKEDLKEGKITGCGPYILEEVCKDHCTLKAFKDYFGGVPYIDRINVGFMGDSTAQGFVDGKYDLVTINKKTEYELVKDIPNIKIKTASIMGTYYAGINMRTNSELSKNKEVRKALNMAINRKKIIDEILGGLGEVAKGPLPPALVDNAYLSGFEYNPEAARKIIEKYAVLKSKKTLKVYVRDESEDTLFNRMSQYIMNDLKVLGFEFEINKVHNSMYLKAETLSNCDMFFARWIADTSDADNYLQPMFNYNNITDFTGYRNEEVVENLESTKAILNPYKKLELYKQIQKQIIDDAPWIFVFHPKTAYVMNERVSGADLNPLGFIKYDDIFKE